MSLQCGETDFFLMTIGHYLCHPFLQIMDHNIEVAFSVLKKIIPAHFLVHTSFWEIL